MAKLYIEATSDKGGRVASKGGDTKIITHYYQGNTRTHTVVSEVGLLTVFTLAKDGSSNDMKIFTA